MLLVLLQSRLINALRRWRIWNDFFICYKNHHLVTIYGWKLKRLTIDDAAVILILVTKKIRPETFLVSLLNDLKLERVWVARLGSYRISQRSFLHLSWFKCVAKSGTLQKFTLCNVYMFLQIRLRCTLKQVPIAILAAVCDFLDKTFTIGMQFVLLLWFITLVKLFRPL